MENMRKIKILKLIILLAVLGLGAFAFSVPAQAANWYVNSNCANDGNGTAATCATNSGGVGARKVLEDAVWATGVSSGDIVIAIAGTYADTSFGKSGIKIKSQNRGGAVIDCGDKTVAGGKRGFESSDNVSNVTIEGFEIRNCFLGIHVNQSNNNITIKNNTIHNVLGGINTGGLSSDTLVDGNSVYDFGYVLGPGFNDQLQINQYHGIYMRGSNAKIINNIVYRNLADGYHVQIGTESGNSGSIDGDWLIANNTFVGVPGKYWAHIGFYGVTSFNSVTLENNISDGATILAWANTPSSAWIFKNNLTNNSSTDVCRSYASSPPDWNTCPSTLITGNIIGDPAFINRDNHNYNLTANSPAKDKGLDLSAIVTTDYLGTIRPQPQGGVYDIGAYEYVSSPTTYYYAAPQNHNPTPVTSGNCTYTNPCTPEYAIDIRSTAGDTIILKNGIYKGGADYMINVNSSGTSGNSKTIKAENDGQVTIDGQHIRTPCSIVLTSYIGIEGINCLNGLHDTFGVSGSHHINVKRMWSHNDGEGGEFIPGYTDDDHRRETQAFNIHYSSEGAMPVSEYVLVEDSFATGFWRKGFIAAGANHITFRRTWAQYRSDAHTRSGGGASCHSAYGAHHIIFENNICVEHPQADYRSGQGTFPFSTTAAVGSQYLSYNDVFYGNISYENVNLAKTAYFARLNGNNSQGAHDNTMIDNVSINNNDGIFIVEEKDFIINYNTIVSDNYGMQISEGNFPKWEMSGIVSYNIFLNPRNPGCPTETLANCDHAINLLDGAHATNTYNMIYGATTPTHRNLAVAASETTNIEPAYNIGTYGHGAYLIRPSNSGGAGAEVLYRYYETEEFNSATTTLSSSPLWPWSMEDRICKETGHSVTWASDCNESECHINEKGCPNGGGLWKTLDGVYTNPADVNSDTHVNIKDIQICIKAITSPSSISTEHLQKCKELAPPDSVANIKDIQVIIREIINPS